MPGVCSFCGRGRGRSRIYRHLFSDIYFRNSRAPEEKKALHSYLVRADSSLVATASHGFGWDGLRLLIEASWKAAGSEAERQVEFLEPQRIFRRYRYADFFKTGP